MALFIVKGYYEVEHYMRENEPERYAAMHPVEAENEYDAREKFIHHYEKRTDPYAVYYSACVEDVFETLS